MTTYTAIPDASLEPGKPARSVDAILLRDNPIAIAEGSAGAPKIQAAALDVTTSERDWVLDRNSEASVGEVGTYAFLIPETISDTDTNPGSTRAGSSLRYAGVGPAGASQLTLFNGVYLDLGFAFSGSSPSGTWRCMGYSNNENTSFKDWVTATLWLRIS